MPKLHELLAAEGTVLGALKTLFGETENKLGKEHFFAGHDKSLALIADSPDKSAVESAARDIKSLPATVPETIGYLANYWISGEDLLFQKNVSNQSAKADIEFNGKVVVSDVPVDELLGLESRLTNLRGLFSKLPTLDASKKWVPDENRDYVWQTETPEVTLKQEREISSVVLAQPTDKFPAQIKEISKDVVKGSFTTVKYSGAITSRAKAEALANIDTLIMEIKKARTRANQQEASTVKIGQALMDVIVAPIFAKATDNK